MWGKHVTHSYSGWRNVGQGCREMNLRNLAERILIAAPGHLEDAWRRELKDKFEETFVAVGRGILGAHYAENVRDRENQGITSMDFAKRDDMRENSWIPTV